jgi:hypothetical protein
MIRIPTPSSSHANFDPSMLEYRGLVNSSPARPEYSRSPSAVEATAEERVGAILSISVSSAPMLHPTRSAPFHCDALLAEHISSSWVFLYPIPSYLSKELLALHAVLYLPHRPFQGSP